jgi:stage II sporulation protein P
MDLNRLLYQDLSVDKETDGPQILIYHTHAAEGFADSVPGDDSTTIVGAGEYLAQLLQEKYGFQVLHHTGKYDGNRDEAYNEALPKIEKLLEENPTIEVVIDLHRDAVSEERKLVMDLQGRPTARFMFFNGLSYGRSSGEISYLENPYIQENLSLSFQAQVAANQYYPGIARKIYLKAYRFNMHLKPKSMLIELGAQNNTVEEIWNACEPLAHILSIVLG